jgi:hypothetical protein
MLVRPSSVAPRRMHNPKNRIRANKVPRIDGSTAVRRIARELFRIDGLDSAAYAGWCPPVQEGLVDINSLVEFGCRAGRRRPRVQRPGAPATPFPVVVAGGSSERSYATS